PAGSAGSPRAGTELRRTMEYRRASTRQTITPIGVTLVNKGLVTEDDIEMALAEQQITRERLGDILVSHGLITGTQVVRILAEQFGIQFVDLEDQVADFTAGRAIREPFARRFRAVGIRWDGERLVVALANPADVFALDD